MNLLLLRDEEMTGATTARLTGRRARHVRAVIGVEVGQCLRAGRPNGPMGETEVVAIGDEDGDYVDVVFREVEVKIGGKSECGPEAQPLRDVDLLLAVPRPKVLRRLFETIAAYAVRRLILVRSWRVEKSYLASDVLEPAHYREHLYNGLEQGMHTRVLEVIVEPRFRPFVEDRLPALVAGTTSLLAHLTAKAWISDTVAAERRDDDASMIHSDRRAILVAIGPEGGWVEFEVEKLRGAGLVPVRLSDRVLRVETAVIAALAQIETPNS